MGNVMQYSNNTAPVIRLTEAAEHRIITYLSAHQHNALRLSVKKTGCSGLSYVIDYVNEPEETDVIVPIATTPYLICIEKKSYPYLKGIEMDYVKQGLNQKFVFNNPNQTGQCGCGESFTVE
jgi:iron-sulfur cluster assembly protein